MGNNQNPYYFLDTYCLRTPLLSLSFFKELVKKDGDSRTVLSQYWKDAIIKEAIFLASNNLYNTLDQYFSDSGSEEDEGLEETFYKYLIRMSTRCTPFGLFSGVCTATIDQTNGSERKPHRKTAFDNHFLQALSEKLSQIKGIKEQLPFYVNSSLYKAAGYIRYIDYQLKDKRRAYSLEAVTVTDHLESTLLLAKQGKTIDQLSNNLVSETVTFADAKSFINLLIDNKLLVSQLELNVTGEDVLSLHIELLKQYEGTDELVQNLEDLAVSLNTLDQKLGNNKLAYERLIGKIKALNVSGVRKYLFQTDLSLKRDLRLIDSKKAYALRRVLPLLMKFCPYNEFEKLNDFKKAFRKRWEDQEIPLATALDIESGIGYVQNTRISNTTPFLDDVTPYSPPSKSVSYSLDESDQVVYKKLLEAKAQDAYSMELTDEDFAHIDLDWENLPDTLACSVQVLPDEQKTIYLSGFSIGAAKLLARFCHCDEGVSKLTHKIAALEQSMNPDEILAEIAHLPEARVGNILKRPHLRDYEIPYIAHSTLPEEGQLAIDDLMVSVVENRIVLKSKALQKEVLPMLTNAHNYSAKSLPIYYFLCDLENQNKHRYIGFTWPILAYRLKFLPRVMYKNICLSMARWILGKDEIEKINNWHRVERVLKDVDNWRKKHQIPRYIQMVSGDSTLPIDLCELKSIELFKNSSKNKEQLTIEESLHLELLNGKEEERVFANELVIPFYNKTKLAH